jgi:DNA-binding NarL/FixJ family response regulator
VIRVAVVDDHPVFRSGLRTLVEESELLEFAGEAADGEAAVTLCVTKPPDVVLMDVRMPGTSGVDATRRILDAEPSVGVLMLTMLEDDTSLVAALRAGARGYVLKGAPPDEIVRAVVAVASGQAVFGSGVAGRVTGLVASGGRSHPFPELTLRERDILDLVARGRANHEIAARLGLSEKTVRNNVSSIFAKLRVADRSALIVRAREAGVGR